MGYYAVERSGFLAHHGILGQKWGIRRFQNYDGTLKNPKGIKKALKRQKKIDDLARKGIRDKSLVEEHTIPVGTKIYRTTANPTESSDGVKYVSYADADRVHYNGGWIRMTGKTESAFEHTYELTEDIKVPSRKESQKVVSDLLDGDKKLLSKTIVSWINMVYPEGSARRAAALTDPETGEQTGKFEDLVRDVATGFMKQPKENQAFFAMQTFGSNPDLRTKVIDTLKSRGYNGMTDEASVGGRNGWGKEGIDPLIVFDGKILKETGKREIDSKEEARNLSEFDKYKNGWTKYSLLNPGKDSGW